VAGGAGKVILGGIRREREKVGKQEQRCSYEMCRNVLL
jgi:hypothetical protein